jgi:hypothetical protein
MKVVCAWCEVEGKETLIGEIGLYDWQVTSHGICIDHEKAVLMQIKDLRMQQNPRLRRQRRHRTVPASARPSLSLATGFAACTTAWRRRRHHSYGSSAQLSLPFGDS